MPPTAGVLPPNALLQPAAVRHLPVVREVLDRLGITSTLNRLFPKDGRMGVSDADCISLMVLNILHGRVALYKMNEWLAGTDVEVVLGQDCPPDAFYDDRLAGTLDRVARHGIDDVLSEVVVGYLRSDACPTEYQAGLDPRFGHPAETTVDALCWRGEDASPRMR